MFNKTAKYKFPRLFSVLFLSAVPLIGGNVLAMDILEEQQTYIPASLSVPKSAIIEQWMQPRYQRRIAVSGITYALDGHLNEEAGYQFLRSAKSEAPIEFLLHIPSSPFHNNLPIYWNCEISRSTPDYKTIGCYLTLHKV
jgi:hypothetical protein